jgi:hypothetical protein
MPDTRTSNVVSIEHARPAQHRRILHALDLSKLDRDGAIPDVVSTIQSSRPCRSGVYSRLNDDGQLEFGFHGCDSADAAHHLLALSKLIGRLGAIVAQRGDDLLDCTGHLVLSDCEVSRG